MAIFSVLLYVTLFTSLFFEIFLLITYFEIRDEIKQEKAKGVTPLKSYPSVTIVVPCHNEEATVAGTIESLLGLDYPADKLSVVIVNDGSTDRTLEVIQKQFGSNNKIQIFSKENGGKYTALNFALEKIGTDLVGCLDADSFVDRTALRRIIPHFDDGEVMAVTPSIVIHEPKSVLQHVQKIEYSWGVFLRRMLASMNSLYVTPGPFSIFRTQVFQKIGGYRHAHFTEDMEMALRLQKNGYKIANSHTAVVYTVGPRKLKGLYKQRVRWTYGFLNNVIDYRELLFNKKYGHIGMFILPLGTFSIFSTLYATGNFIWSTCRKFTEQIARYQAVGFNFGLPHFELSKVRWFAFDTSMIFWITITVVVLTLVLLALSLHLVNGKVLMGKGLVYYLSLYLFIVPLWLATATYSTVARRQIGWK